MEQRDMEQSLRLLCSQETPVTVLLIGSKGICRGRFRDLSNSLINVEIMERGEAVQFRPFLQCVLTCLLGNRSLVFVTSVKDFYSDRYPEILVVQMPDEMASESRTAFRFPIYEEDKPLVVISQEDQCWNVRAIDLSVTGILVEFKQDEVPALEAGEKIVVQLEFENTEIKLKAEVRRIDKNRVGLFFFEVWQGERLNPPDELAELVRRFETLWIHRRIV